MGNSADKLESGALKSSTRVSKGLKRDWARKTRSSTLSGGMKYGYSVEVLVSPWWPGQSL